MPSFYKTLLLGKELSNPYVNPYHPGHSAQTGPETTAQHSMPGAYSGRSKTPDTGKTNPYVGPYSAARNNSKHDTRSRIERGEAGREYASRRVEGMGEEEGERTGRGSGTRGSRKWWARSKRREEEREDEAPGSRSPSPTMLEEARRLAGRDPVTGKKKQERSQAQVQGLEQLTSYNARSGRSLVQTAQPQPSIGLQNQTEEERRIADREIGGYFAPERPVAREYYGGGV